MERMTSSDAVQDMMCLGSRPRINCGAGAKLIQTGMKSRVKRVFNFKPAGHPQSVSSGKGCGKKSATDRMLAEKEGQDNAEEAASAAKGYRLVQTLAIEKFEKEKVHALCDQHGWNAHYNRLE